MDSSHYDHEQDELDYYERESEKRLNSCLFSFKAMGILTIIFLIGMILFGCSANRHPVTTPIGYVISVDDAEVLVAYEVLNKSRGSQVIQWFHIPGHTYAKGNRYPDPSKDPHL